MTDVQIYGIKNCDTMKKALQWLEQNHITYQFHDYKKDGVDQTILRSALKQHGWEIVINQRGTTWRALPGAVKDSMTADTAMEIALKNPSIIKRPLLKIEEKITLGFKKEEYEIIFS